VVVHLSPGIECPLGLGQVEQLAVLQLLCGYCKREIAILEHTA
jgi:hypothetical protein